MKKQLIIALTFIAIGSVNAGKMEPLTAMKTNKTEASKPSNTMNTAVKTMGKPSMEELTNQLADLQKAVNGLLSTEKELTQKFSQLSDEVAKKQEGKPKAGETREPKAEKEMPEETAKYKIEYQPEEEEVWEDWE